MANYYVVQDGDSTGPFDRDRLKGTSKNAFPFS